MKEESSAVAAARAIFAAAPAAELVSAPPKSVYRPGMLNRASPATKEAGPGHSFVFSSLPAVTAVSCPRNHW